MSVTERIYPKLPVALQNVACSLQGAREARVRFGPFFRDKLDELTGSDMWTAAQVDAHQSEQLQALVRHAYDTVPYYRSVMKERGVQPGDIRDRADLHKLPLFTKEDVRSNFESLQSSATPNGAMIDRHTSGTTGKSLHFLSTRESIAFQWAVWWRHRQRFGLRFGDEHVNFTGKLVVPPAQSRPPYWRYNKPMHQVLINMQHLVPGRIGDIIHFLDRTEAAFYSGYPSIIHALCTVAEEEGVTLHHAPPLIDTGAENVLDFQRRDIERFTGARMIDQYGFSEGCGNASQCEAGVYHEDFEFGILECVDPVVQPDGSMQGRIVCTGFANRGFPFIRYDVGDTATWAPEGYRCSCGRQSRVILSIDGRKDDYVVTPEGSRVMRFDYIFKESERVKESQVVQSELGSITIRVVPRPGFSAGDTEKIREQVRKWISPSLRVEFEVVEAIERERAGKFRAVKSLLPRA